MSGRRNRRNRVPAGLFVPARVLSTGDGRRARSARRRRITSAGSPASGGDRPTAPAPVGERDPSPVLVQVVIDESPSEYDVDPHGHRHVAARRIVELLRTDLACRGDRVAVVHFAERPEPVLRPQDPHTRRGHRRLRRSLRPRGAGATTDICAALETAARLVPKRWSGPTVTLVMTDGLDESSPEDLAAAVGRFPPRSVHLISVGTEVPGAWSYVPLGSMTIVRSAERPDAIEWRVAQVIYLALGVS